jgi:pectinesterase
MNTRWLPLAAALLWVEFDAATLIAQEPAPATDAVHVTRDIVYAQYGERAVQLDLYLPAAKSGKPRPCIVVIHGGGWRTGNKERFSRFATRLTEEGFAAACIGYRLLPEATIAQCVEDCKAAVRWVRAHAAEHNIDPDRIGAIGGSAGGHLTAMLATSHAVKELEGDGGNAGVSSRIQAAVGMATPAEMSRFGQRTNLSEEKAKLISPLAHVDKDSAPILLIHSNADGTVPYEQSVRLEKKYQEAGVRAELIEIDGASHAFWNQPEHFDATMGRAVKFFREVLKAPE